MYSMKYYKKGGEVYAFDQDQLHLVTDDMQPMTVVEFDKHINPLKYMNKSELIEYRTSTLGFITRKQLKLALLELNILSKFEESIQNLDDEKTKLKAKIVYEDSITLDRTDATIILIFTKLGFTQEQLNNFWELALTL